MAFSPSRQYFRKFASPLQKSPRSLLKHKPTLSPIEVNFAKISQLPKPSFACHAVAIPGLKKLAASQLAFVEDNLAGGQANSLEEVKSPSVDTPDRSEILKEGLNARRFWNKLGQGSFGTVVQAIYKGKDVAVKVVREVHSDTLCNEANAVHLSHPNIIQVLRVISSQGQYGLVIMEMFNGSNLQTLLQDSSFDFTFALRMKFAIGIASAIQHCHSLGVLHLDVKPLNVVCVKDLCKLCDFGCSRDFSSTEHCLLFTQEGTSIYTDPDILVDGSASKMSDIFSLGITLWQLLSREIPYKSYKIDKHTIIYRVIAEKLRPQEFESFEQRDEDYKTLYKMCWQPEAINRPSIETIVHELERIRVHGLD